MLKNVILAAQTIIISEMHQTSALCIIHQGKDSFHYLLTFIMHCKFNLRNLFRSPQSYATELQKKYKVLRDTAVVPHCHPLFVWPVPNHIPGKASFKLC